MNCLPKLFKFEERMYDGKYSIAKKDKCKRL